MYGWEAGGTHPISYLNVFLLLPAPKLRQGNVFTPVCGSVHRRGGLCPGGSLSGGSQSRRWGVCVQGVCVQGSLCQEDPHCCHTVTCGRYTSYWYAFLLRKYIYHSCMHTVEEELGILTYNGPMFSLSRFHFQFKSVNISTILTSKLKMCTYI